MFHCFIALSFLLIIEEMKRKKDQFLSQKRQDNFILPKKKENFLFFTFNLTFISS